MTGVQATTLGGFEQLESLAIPAVGDGTEIAELLAHAKALRRVELGTDLWRDELVDLLLRMPIEHLRIGGQAVDAAALKRLPLFPHLRSLDLFLCQIGPDELTALASVKQLTTVRLRMIAWHQPAGHAEVVDTAALQRKLPKCAVINDDS